VSSASERSRLRTLKGILNEYITPKFLGKKSKSQHLKTGPGLAEYLQLFALAASEARRSITDFNIFEGFTAVHKNLEFLFSGAFVFDKM